MRIVFALFVFLAAVVAALAPASARYKPAQRPSASQACMPQDLKRTIAEIERRFGAVQVLSTNRPGAKIAGSGRAASMPIAAR